MLKGDKLVRYGIIDLGSNTIRTVVYETEGRDFKKLFTERSFTGILNYIEEGILRPDGIEAIRQTVGRMAQLCQMLGCADIHAFATASLRGVKNAQEVCDSLAQTGTQLRLLSGEEEAACDFAGLMAADLPADGIGFDLGGGSCQIFRYASRELTSSVSLPIGSLALYNRFVRGILPTQKQRKEIRRFVRSELLAARIAEGKQFDRIFAIGGTARAAAKLHRALTGQSRPVEGYPLTVEQLEELCKLMTALDMHGLRLIERVAPERITTLVPGILAIRTICRVLDAEQIQVVKNGVREGYLCRYLLR
ncbi:MAG: hypothetical protein DBX44_01005 [Oscillospiraceae bacterium]|nr:MAG: hypothetical protein DBX44_01005 [Oscillospiraceae bacterium]